MLPHKRSEFGINTGVAMRLKCLTFNNVGFWCADLIVFQLGILMDVLVGNLWRDNYRYVVKNVFSKDTIFSRT